jgi:hypothetical protein
MARGNHWWSEPPWWAWVAIVIGAVLLVVGLPFAMHRGALEATTASSVKASTANSAPSTGPTAASTTPAPAKRLVVVIGDSRTAAADHPDGGWPAALAARVPDVDVRTASAGDGGYVTTDPAVGRTFGQLVDADQDLPNADVVVLAGSAYDASGIADQVATASRATIQSVAARAPNAVLVVIGPVWPTESVPAGVRNNRDVIQQAVEGTGARFVDPLTERWLVGDPSLVGADGRLTDAGVANLADRVQPLVTEALAG